MKTLEELKLDRDDALRSIGELLGLSVKEERDFTEDEQKRYDDLKSKEVRLKKQITALEENASERALITKADDNQPSSRSKDIGKADTKIEMGEDRSKSKSQWRDISEFMKAVVTASDPLKRGKVDDRLFSPDGFNAEQRAGLGMNVAVDAEGGFLVDQPLSQELLTKAFDVGKLFPKARQIPIAANANSIKINALEDADRTDGNRAGGVVVDWVAEGATTAEGRPTFRQIELNLNKLLGFVYATEEMMQDYGATASIIQQTLSDEIAYRLDRSVLLGDGIGKPLGLLSSGAKIALTRTGAGLIQYADIVAMEEALWGRSDDNAVYYASKSIFPQLMNMTFRTTAGDQHPVFLTMNAGATEAPRRTLMGRPIEFLEQSPILGTEGDLVLADMNQYLFATKGGLKQAFSMHVRFLFEENVWRVSFRADGTLSWNTPLTRADGVGTESPVITIAA